MGSIVHCADNLEILRALPDASIDSIVTDPPYEIGMMGQAWDASGVAFEVARWRECLRVLKPGGYLIAFSSARTYHRLAVAVEDAGFEIRDQLVWIYGTGFPKSPRDITAAIDRNRGDDPRPVCRWLRQAVEAQGRRPADLDALFGLAGMGGHWCATNRNTQPTVPTPEQWAAILELLGVEPPDDVAEAFAELTARKGMAGEAWEDRPVVGEHSRPNAAAMWRSNYDGDSARAAEIRDATPTKAEASPWIGWATALRPSHEPAVMGRKPFTGPTYRNVLEHGTGAINVGACRMPMSAEDAARIDGMAGFGRAGYDRPVGVSLNLSVDPIASQDSAAHPGGRWPPNVLLSPMAAADLDGHAAGVSRYFYCDKASTAERESGLDDGAPAARWTDGRDKAANYPSQRGEAVRKNIHPTVKPIDVCRWLVRLVTPPGGTVLDPYTGSGSTGIAAVLEGFEFIGAELDPAHVEIADKRIAAALAGAFYIDGGRGGRTSIRSPLARRQCGFEF